MALIPWRPWLWRPWEDIERLFEDWKEEWPEIRAAEFIPPVDIYEKGGNLVVETPITGVDPEKIEVLVENNNLILKGKSEKKSEVEDKNYYRKEVRYGSFYRAIGLPTKVIGDKAEATYEDGLLRITIPKAEEVKEKKIKIKIKKSAKK
ncbi:MAG: Hsp20/alpha crystallin family protein [Patescibacteria group bacterium]|nr:Hsp20/alpha crystallin family protein [Patescibacteria group bacterium]